MKTIAICNHKGGVGKTALSMAIAEGLHRKGKRTLLVDLDQQMNATQQAKIDTTDEVTVYDLLTSFDYTAKDGIKHFDGGDIIPGDVLVSNAESDMAKLDTRLTMLSVVLEESSKRYVITFRQLGEDSDETIRSERTDGRRGKDVMQLWGRDLKNHICILFKHNEESKDPSKSGGFRVAPYVIDLGLQKN